MKTINRMPTMLAAHGGQGKEKIGMTRYFTLIFSLLFISCASPIIKVPAKHQIQTSFDLAIPYEKLWETVKTILNEKKIPVTYEDKSLGVIKAKKTELFDNGVYYSDSSLDCGKVYTGIFGEGEVIFGVVEVLKKETNYEFKFTRQFLDNMTTLKINVDGQLKYVGRQFAETKRSSPKYQKCVSTGRIEENFVDEIKNKLKKSL